MFALAAAASMASAAADTTVLVTPTVVEVSPEQPWADISIRNDGTEVVDVRAETFGWKQDELGRVSLTPVRDVSVFPAGAKLEPGEARRFRISVLRAPGRRERAYRLALDMRHAEGGAGAVVTRALVPVFVEPVRPVVSARIEIVQGPGSSCRVVLRNEGTVRFRPPRVSLAVRGQDGTVVERAFGAWWVLAGDVRTFDFDLPMAADEIRDVAARARVADELVTSAERGCGSGKRGGEARE